MSENSYRTDIVAFSSLNLKDPIIFSRNSDGYYPHMLSGDG